MSVNLSARQLSDLALPRQVAEALERHGVPAGRARPRGHRDRDPLRPGAGSTSSSPALRGLGVAIAVDDYGTGQASLNYLKRLEIDELKVDKSFVSDMGRDHLDFVIVRSTIALARDLGLRVVAEGIQEEETAVALRDLGCGVGQGYHLGRPTTPDDILERLESEARAARRGRCRRRVAARRHAASSTDGPVRRRAGGVAVRLGARARAVHGTMRG